LITVALNALQGSLASLDVPLVWVQGAVLILVTTAAVAGMYRLALELLPGHPHSKKNRWLAALVALLWVANPFALSFVWYQQLLIQFTWGCCLGSRGCCL
jgi:hypothetical protein